MGRPLATKPGRASFSRALACHFAKASWAARPDSAQALDLIFLIPFSILEIV
jgi:hypothetical protein